jgi:hypothetical protein
MLPSLGWRPAWHYLDFGTTQGALPVQVTLASSYIMGGTARLLALPLRESYGSWRLIV